MTNSTSLDRILKLANRVVRTEKGARLYGKPIGSPILPEEDQKPAPKKAPKGAGVSSATAPEGRTPFKKVQSGATATRGVSLERVKSLQAQAKAAIRTGDSAQIKRARAAFNEALAAFAGERPATQVIAELKKSLLPEKK